MCPKVSIGMPVYNGEKFIRQALDSLLAQTFTNFELIISDNASTDGTEAICREYASHDSRIRYVRQNENRGACANFQFVLDEAVGEYFMWGANDDLWENNFIDTGVRTLTKNPFYQSWFCTVDNIDRLDRTIRNYAGFSRYTSTKDKKNDIVKYLQEPNWFGKANLIYSLFQKEAIKTTADEYFFNESYSSDTVFNLAFLVRYNLIATDEVLLHKRTARKSIQDRPDKIIPIAPKKPHAMKPKRMIRYIYECYKATRTTKYKKIVLLALMSQIPKIILSGMQHSFDSICKFIKSGYK